MTYGLHFEDPELSAAITERSAFSPFEHDRITRGIVYDLCKLVEMSDPRFVAGLNAFWNDTFPAPAHLADDLVALQHEWDTAYWDADDAGDTSTAESAFAKAKATAALIAALNPNREAACQDVVYEAFHATQHAHGTQMLERTQELLPHPEIVQVGLFNRFVPRILPGWTPYPDPHLREAVLRVMQALVDRDTDTLNSLPPNQYSDLTAADLYERLDEHGATFVMPPDADTFDWLSGIINITDDGTGVGIDLDLYSVEELRSELTLSLTCDKTASGWICTIEDLHVM